MDRAEQIWSQLCEYWHVIPGIIQRAATGYGCEDVANATGFDGVTGEWTTMLRERGLRK